MPSRVLSVVAAAAHDIGLREGSVLGTHNDLYWHTQPGGLEGVAPELAGEPYSAAAVVSWFLRGADLDLREAFSNVFHIPTLLTEAQRDGWVLTGPTPGAIMVRCDVADYPRWGETGSFYQAGLCISGDEGGFAYIIEANACGNGSWHTVKAVQLGIDPHRVENQARCGDVNEFDGVVLTSVRWTTVDHYGYLSDGKVSCAFIWPGGPDGPYGHPALASLAFAAPHVAPVSTAVLPPVWPSTAVPASVLPADAGTAFHPPTVPAAAVQQLLEDVFEARIAAAVAELDRVIVLAVAAAVENLRNRGYR